MAKDPVCGMDVDESNPPATAEYKGQTYYFCAPGCRAAFEADPEKYLGYKEEKNNPGCGGGRRET